MIISVECLLGIVTFVFYHSRAMGFYSEKILPVLLDWGMKSERFIPYRREALKQAYGKVLEIGFGTGLNLPFYPQAVEEIHVVEVNKGMKLRAEKNIRRSGHTIHFHWLNADSLPFDNEQFDTVVSTWTLCSIEAVDQALKEVKRVLKPEGKFLFAEHGLAPSKNIQRWQRWLTPIQKRVAGGCHLDRNMEELIKQAGFVINPLRKEYLAGASRIGGFTYFGVARINQNFK